MGQQNTEERQGRQIKGLPWANWSLLFGFDIFISYRRSEASAYANELYSRLTGKYVCFLDDHGAPPGTPLTEPIERALKRSRVLILIASGGALQSDWVGREVEKFGASGKPIIPINIQRTLNNNALAGTRFEVLKRDDIVWIDEQIDISPSGHPSDGVLKSFDRLFIWRRAKRNIEAFVAVVVLALLMFSIFSFIQMKAASRESKRARSEAYRATYEAAEAERQKAVATSNAREASRERDQAEIQRAAALRSAHLADVQRRLAETNQHEAETQRDLAIGRRMLTEANSIGLYGNLEQRALLTATSVRFFGDRTGSETNNAMLSALAEYPARLLHLKGIVGAAFTNIPDELATIDDTGVLTVWDVNTRRPLRKRSCNPVPSSITYDKERQVIITVAADQTLRMFDPKSLEESRKLKVPVAGHVTVVPGERYALVDRSRRRFSNPDDYGYSLVNLDSGAITNLNESDCSAKQVLFTKDGKRLAIHLASIKDYAVHVELRDALSQKLITSIPVEQRDLPGGGATAANMFFSEDSTTLWVSTSNGLKSWRASDGKFEENSGQSDTLGIAAAGLFEASGETYLVSPRRGGFVLTGFDSNDQVREINVPHLMEFQFSPGGRYLIAHGGSTGGSEGNIYIWDRFDDWKELRVDDAEGLLFNASGDLVAGIDYLDQLALWNIGDRGYTNLLPEPILPGEKVKAGKRNIARQSSESLFRGLTEVTSTRRYPAPNVSSYFGGNFHRDGDYQTADGQWRIEKKGNGPTYIIGTSSKMRPIYIPEDAWAVTPEGDLLAYMTSPNWRSPNQNNVVHILFISPRSVEKQCEIPRYMGLHTRITPVRHLLLVGTTFLDPGTCKTPSTSIDDSNFVMSEDEQKVATIGSHGLLVYDLSEDKELLRVDREVDVLSRVIAFRSDDQAVVVSSKDSVGVIHFHEYRFDTKSLIHEVCSRVHRTELSPEDWRELVDPQIPRTSPCPDAGIMTQEDNAFDNTYY